MIFRTAPWCTFKNIILVRNLANIFTQKKLTSEIVFRKSFEIRVLMQLFQEEGEASLVFKLTVRCERTLGRKTNLKGKKINNVFVCMVSAKKKKDYGNTSKRRNRRISNANGISSTQKKSIIKYNLVSSIVCTGMNSHNKEKREYIKKFT